MRLDFNVLWVDDQPDRVTAQIRSLASQMATEGFELMPRQCKTLDEVINVISQDVFTDEVDLILVDWDLGNGEYGENAIKRIRESVQYRDVVFYSGQLTVSELRQKAYENQLEGVYFSSRENLVDEVLGVFNSLIKKVLDLDHTRGIVMGATSDIDHIVLTCLNVAHEKLDESGKAQFIQDAVKRVAEQVENIQRQGERFQAAPSLEALFRAHMLFTSTHRLRMLANVLRMNEFAAHAAAIATLNTYQDGVLGHRNKLGHAVLSPQGKSGSVVDEAGNAVGIDEMRKLRKLILSLRAEFRTLLNGMQS
jgi:cell division protein ZapA (FtsZ GTPase activity inhibitor)